MTPFLVMSLAVMAAYAVYLAALVARHGPAPSAFIDGGANLPGWAVIFAGSGLAVAGQGLGDQLALTARFGLQASHLGLGLVLAMAALVHVRRDSLETFIVRKLLVCYAALMAVAGIIFTYSRTVRT